MTQPTQPPPHANRPPWATHVLIPTLWTPEQALAVFELLDELRDRVASLYLDQLQALLQEQQGRHDADNGAGHAPDDDRRF
jgi:hypothetical protein